MRKLKIKLIVFFLLTCLGIVAGFSSANIYNHISSELLQGSTGGLTGKFYESEMSRESNNQCVNCTVKDFVDFSVEGEVYSLLRKNMSGVAETETGLRFKVETNNKGLRDDFFDKSPSADTYRILFIGDSYTFGWGINETNRHSEILQRRLNRDHKKKFQVINAGSYGWGMKDYYKFLKYRGLEYNPDMVIFGLVGNDYISHRKHAELQKEALGEVEREYNRSELSDLEYHNLMVQAMRGKLDNYRARIPKNESDTYVYTSKIENLSEMQNLETIFYQVGCIYYRDRQIIESFDVDLVGHPLPKCSMKKYKFENDSHPNYEAQPLIADKIYQHLNKNYLFSN